jgi:hypothetical protein
MTFIAQNKIVNELHFTDDLKLLNIFLWIKFLFILRFHKFSQMDFHSINPSSFIKMNTKKTIKFELETFQFALNQKLMFKKLY